MKIRKIKSMASLAVESALKDNKGYCPCALEYNEDTFCMCKDFREKDTIGECTCGLFEKFDD